MKTADAACVVHATDQSPVSPHLSLSIHLPPASDRLTKWNFRLQSNFYYLFISSFARTRSAKPPERCRVKVASFRVEQEISRGTSTNETCWFMCCPNKKKINNTRKKRHKGKVGAKKKTATNRYISQRGWGNQVQRWMLAVWKSERVGKKYPSYPLLKHTIMQTGVIESLRISGQASKYVILNSLWWRKLCSCEKEASGRWQTRGKASRGRRE